MKDSLKEEAQAFDERFSERIRNGLIPDLRRAARLDWFFNNPWRRPEFVDAIFGDYLRFALRHIAPGSHVLEIGSGLGHLCLEMARLGHHVTGLELSPASVEIARKFADENPYKETFGSLDYVNADFMSWNAPQPYDAICFFLTLHHFENPQAVLAAVKKWLKPGGKIIVVEPARDFFSERNAGIVNLVRQLLSVTGNWHQSGLASGSESDFESSTLDILDEYRDAKDKHEKAQSPHDNDCYAADMLNALDAHFSKLELSHANSLTPRMLGGFRGTEEQALELARIFKMFDNIATAKGWIEPGVILYAGENK